MLISTRGLKVKTYFLSCNGKMFFYDVTSPTSIVWKDLRKPNCASNLSHQTEGQYYDRLKFLVIEFFNHLQLVELDIGSFAELNVFSNINSSIWVNELSAERCVRLLQSADHVASWLNYLRGRVSRRWVQWFGLKLRSTRDTCPDAIFSNDNSTFGGAVLYETNRQKVTITVHQIIGNYYWNSFIIINNLLLIVMI